MDARADEHADEESVEVKERRLRNVGWGRVVGSWVGVRVLVEERTRIIMSATTSSRNI